MNLNDVVLILLGIFGVGFFWQRGRAKTSAALLNNIADKEALAKNKGSVEAEEQKIEELKKEVLSGKELEDFFNNHNLND